MVQDYPLTRPSPGANFPIHPPSPTLTWRDLPEGRIPLNKYFFLYTVVGPSTDLPDQYRLSTPTHVYDSIVSLQTEPTNPLQLVRVILFYFPPTSIRCRTEVKFVNRRRGRVSGKTHGFQTPEDYSYDHDTGLCYSRQANVYFDESKTRYLRKMSNVIDKHTVTNTTVGRTGFSEGRHHSTTRHTMDMCQSLSTWWKLTVTMIWICLSLCLCVCENDTWSTEYQIWFLFHFFRDMFPWYRMFLCFMFIVSLGWHWFCWSTMKIDLSFYGRKRKIWVSILSLCHYMS